MQQHQKFNSIQVLRFFAAVGVSQFHLMPFVVPFQVGGAGVDIFFVISGIVIGLTPTNESALFFSTKRFTRIYPIYWICTGLNIALNVYLWGPSWLPSGHALLHSIPLLPEGDHWTPLYFPAWTLAYEVFFYLLYSLILLIPIARKNYVCAAVMVALSFTHVLGYSSGNLMEFAMGLLVAEFLMAGHRIPRGAALLIIAAVVAWFGYFDNADRYLAIPSQIVRPIMWGIPSSIFIAALVTFEDSKFFNNRLLVFGGAASYCIYLLHITAGVLLTQILAKYGIVTADHPYATVPILVLSAILSGFVVHACIEKPILGAVKRFVMRWVPKVKRVAEPKHSATHNA